MALRPPASKYYKSTIFYCRLFVGTSGGERLVRNIAQGNDLKYEPTQKQESSVLVGKFLLSEAHDAHTTIDTRKQWLMF